MTKRKQRKGRNYKKEARQEMEENRKKSTNHIQSILWESVQLKKANASLAPLYAIMTGLEFQKDGPEGLEVLEKINLQDYGLHMQKECFYSVDLQLSVEDFIALKIALSGVNIDSPQQLKIAVFEGECHFEASLSLAPVVLHGTMVDKTGDWTKHLESRGGDVEIIGRCDQALLGYDLSFDIHTITIAAFILKGALECDNKNVWENLHPKDKLEMIGLAQMAELKHWTAAERRLINQYIEICHQKRVLKHLASAAFEFCLLPVGEHPISVPLYSGRTSFNNEGDPVGWRCDLGCALQVDGLTQLQFVMSGIPFAAQECSEVPFAFPEGICLELVYGHFITLFFNAPRDAISLFESHFFHHDSMDALPKSIMLVAIEMDATKQPALKERLKFLKDYIEAAGNDFSTGDEDESIAMFRRAESVLSKFASL